MAWPEEILRDKDCIGCGKTLRVPYFAQDPKCRDCSEKEAGRQLFPRQPGEPPYEGPNGWDQEPNDGGIVH